MNRPDLEKVPTFYRGYVEKVPEGDLMSLMIESRDNVINVLQDISEDKGAFAYAEGKWTIKELIGHLSDSERVFAYRALRFGRADHTDLAGYEQDDYVQQSRANHLSMAELIREFTNIRNATIDLYNAFDEKALARFGSANGFRIDVNTLGYIIIGHTEHHLNVLKEFYLV